MNSTNSSQDQIDLLNILLYIQKHIRMIIISTCVGFVIGIVLYLVSYFLNSSTELFSIKSTIAVTAQTETGNFSSNSLNPNSSDIHLAESMVDSVIYVCSSDTVLAKAADELQLIGIRPEQIRNELHFQQYKNTQIIQLELTWHNKEEGIHILQAITHVLPDVLIDVLKLGSVTVINDPQATSYFDIPIQPKHVILITMLFFIGAVGLCVIEMLLFPSLTNTDDVQRIFHLEIYGKIPVDVNYKNRKGMYANESLYCKENNVLSPMVAESFTSAAYTLGFQLSQNRNSPIACFTSSTEQEGKTTVVANLGMQLAKQHNKVLLLDLDLRKPSLSGLFLKEADYMHSLNGILRRQVPPKEAIVHVNEYLDILPSFLEQNPLYFSPILSRIIKDLSQDYDFTLIDTAPVGQVSDTLFMKNITDYLLYVIRYDTVPISVIKANLDKLITAGIEITGAIINQISRAGSSDVLYSSHYYTDTPSDITPMPDTKEKSSDRSKKLPLLHKREKKSILQEENHDSTIITIHRE